MGEESPETVTETSTICWTGNFRSQKVVEQHPTVNSTQQSGLGNNFAAAAAAAKSLQSYPTVSDPMDCSLPDSSVHGIFQARVLEWGAIAFSINHVLIENPKSTHSDDEFDKKLGSDIMFVLSSNR